MTTGTRGTEVRRKETIYRMDGDWFTGYWHFSFDQYADPQHTQFGSLRVFNVDTLVPGGVWPIHPHREMEVVTYCVDGEFQHEDNLGNDGILYPGDAQHTTIGSGTWHSEINHSREKPMTFIQLWIIPSERGLEPAVEQLHVRPDERRDHLLPLVSNVHPGALPIHQDAEVYAATVTPRVRLERALAPGYGAYVYLISGQVRLNGHELSAGDAAQVRNEAVVTFEGEDQAETFMVVVRV